MMRAYAHRAAPIAGLLLFLHFFAPHCDAGGYGELVVKREEPVRIGVATVLSGQEAFLGREILEGAEAFVKDRRIVLDHPITLVPLDDGCRPATSVEAAREFCAMDPRPVAVVGYICSAAAIEAAKVHIQCGLPLLNVSSPHPLLTAQGSGWVLRLWASHRSQGILLSKWIQAKPFRHLLLLHGRDPSSMAIVGAVEEALSRHSPRPQLRVVPAEESLGGTGKLVQPKDPFHLVYYVGEGWDLADLWKGLPKGLLNIPWLLDARAVATFSLSREAPQPKDIYCFSFPPPSGDPRRPDFLYFMGRFGEPGYYTLAAYDAMSVLVDALQRSGRVLQDGTSWDPQAVVKAMRETRIHGLTGPISFDLRGDRREVFAQIRQWKGRHWEPVWEARIQ